jgi:hypothetical protein
MYVEARNDIHDSTMTKDCWCNSLLAIYLWTLRQQHCQLDSTCVLESRSTATGLSISMNDECIIGSRRLSVSPSTWTRLMDSIPDGNLDLLVAKSILQVDIIEPTALHTATVIFLHVCSRFLSSLTRLTNLTVIGFWRPRVHLSVLCRGAPR